MEAPKGGSMDSSIVCGVDGSADSRAAVRVASALAERLGARLVLANVVDTTTATAAVGPMGSVATSPPLVTENLDALERAGEQMLGEVADEAQLDHAERRVAFGLAAQRLADVADEERAELIVVGSRGRGAFKAAFLGSVSTSLIGLARCPVLVVPAAYAERGGAGPA
jgi:nucleotide-binding universal stress UspA family protein